MGNGFLRACLPGLAICGTVLAAAAGAQTRPIAAGTVVHLRLQQSISSYSAKRNTPVLAMVVEPVLAQGAIVIPSGTEVHGRIAQVQRVGLGFSSERARIRIDFASIELQTGVMQPIALKVTELDNARETVEPDGTIQGIRATASASKILSGAAISAASLDPMSLLFGLSASLSAFRLPESEIVLPAGTELTARLDAPLSSVQIFPPPPAVRADAAQLEALARATPYRTRTKGSNLPSDITTLAMVGDQAAIARALAAAGWVEALPLSAGTKFGVVRSVVENQGFQEGPVSVLLLQGRPPVGAWSKTLNTFFSRHHLRLFATRSTLDGAPVFVASATHDTGIGVNWTKKSMIHLVDENIDAERAKVTADLLLTGCVTGVSAVDRPWIPQKLENATGDRLLTDRRMLVLEFNACTAPKEADVPVVTPAREKASQPTRIVRNGVLFLRDDLYRGNIVYQGWQGGRMGLAAWRNRHTRETAAAGAAPASMNVAGQRYSIVRRADQPAAPLPESLEVMDADEAVPASETATATTNYRTQVQYSISGGYNWFANAFFSAQPIDIAVGSGAAFPLLAFDTELGKGWSIAPRVTLNSWRYVSNEFGYTYSTAALTLKPVFLIPTQGLDLSGMEPETDGGQLRQFTYDVLIHARPNGARFRPYAAVGPSLQLLRLVDSQPSKNQLLRYSIRDVSILVGAYNFGSTPPLEGGGIFQVGLQYGGGFQYFATHHIFLRSGFRETISAQPNYWAGSQKDLQAILDADVPGAFVGRERIGNLLRARNALAGIGFAF